MSFRTTLISFSAYGNEFTGINLFSEETFKIDLFSILNFFLKILVNDFSKFSFFVDARKPNLPVLTPIIGRFKFLTNSIDLRKVPSPPILINKSKLLSRSS